MRQCYKYADYCGTVHIQCFPFSKEQIEKIEKEAKKMLDVHVEDITDEINKRILEKIILQYERLCKKQSCDVPNQL